MEVVIEKPDVEEERKVGCFDDEHGVKIREDSTLIPSEKSAMEYTSARPSSSNPKDSTSFTQEHRLESTKAEMVGVREENEKLKMILTQLTQDYQSLSDIVQREQAKKPINADEEVEETVSLRLGTSSSGQRKEDKMKLVTGKDSERFGGCLTLGLNMKFEGSDDSLKEPVLNLSSDSSSEELKEEGTGGEPWPPSKAAKSARNGDDEVSQQPLVKKARVSVRARCDGPTMNDGCQWRKYGQKVSKGNPCPRAYYRCTVSPACPVRKQVQRCAEDMSILITTYEGTHNHPLPISASAMASTTAAAASMLMSGSSASQPAVGFPGWLSTAICNLATSTNANLHGLNLSVSDNLRSQQFHLPNPLISSTNSHPTVTLDLTGPPSCSFQANQFNSFSSNFTTTTPRYSSTRFNFSSSDTNSLPTYEISKYLNNGAQPYAKSSESLILGRQPYDYLDRSHLQKTIKPSTPTNQHPLTDMLAKAISSDPKFHSALAATITSYVEARGGEDGVKAAGHGLKWGEQHLNSLALPFPAAPQGNGCATSSYFNRLPGLNLNTQQGSLLQQSSLGFPSTKGASASPRDHNTENI
ncbi:hypothetical protein OPV22_025728 [Ensete ventricosum]|uniref:WRKY domain-containing protein n=1 Tax=Ensete ventricosum TaxID=4639 RepID=A0AAV8QAM4_ENSVE|nr:hypothetical protein OPV22_025728 [Ensete ventricosum]